MARAGRATHRSWIAFIVLAALTVAPNARAVDGVIEINQVRALAGGVVPADTPGFPVRLEAGSYRLTGDLLASTTALEVYATNVQIDLNGFSIRCQSCAPGSHGIVAYLDHHVHVSNGVIEDFTGAGIRFPGGVTETTFQGNTLAGNGSPGIVGAATDAGGNYCNPGGGAC